MRKKKILVINPNTSKDTARRIEKECRKIASPETTVKAVCIQSKAKFSSLIVLGYVDLAICTVETIKIAWEKRNDYNGIIIAGFSDVGLDSVRELLDIPVIGIAETAYHIASLLGHKFSVLTCTSKWTPSKEDYVKVLGVQSKLASFRSFGEGEELLTHESTEERLIKVGRKAVEEDNAEVIIIGGGPLVGYGKKIQNVLGVPVIDPTLNALKVMEGLIDLNLCHSKIRKWNRPKEKISNVSYNRGWLEH